jgi:DNA-directed RNA polymerase subunit RPC12/RpoP
MYESLIERISGEIHTKMKQEEDRVTCMVSQEIGYKINTEELIKALQYDRNQYEKGFEDGVKSVEKIGYWVGKYPEHKVLVSKNGCVMESVVCSECGEWLDGSSEDEECSANYCPNCGAKMEKEEEVEE